jgi:hypothetical protein
MERIDTHDDNPEHRKDEQDILGKMLNMIGSLRDELAKLWTRNAVLEKELAELKPNALQDCPSVKGEQPLLRDNREDGQEALDPSAYEGDGGEAVSGVDDVCPEVKCVHCDAEAGDESCCGRPACEACSEFGKFAKSLNKCEIDV